MMSLRGPALFSQLQKPVKAPPILPPRPRAPTTHHTGVRGGSVGSCPWGRGWGWGQGGPQEEWPWVGEARGDGAEPCPGPGGETSAGKGTQEGGTGLSGRVGHGVSHCSCPPGQGGSPSPGHRVSCPHGLPCPPGSPVPRWVPPLPRGDPSHQLRPSDSPLRAEGSPARCPPMSPSPFGGGRGQ